jgi:hypothetical protein
MGASFIAAAPALLGVSRRKEDSSFSEEKEAKRLLSFSWPVTARRRTDKSFAVLFFKKERIS